MDCWSSSLFSSAGTHRGDTRWVSVFYESTSLFLQAAADVSALIIQNKILSQDYERAKVLSLRFESELIHRFKERLKCMEDLQQGMQTALEELV
jgi:hypothetical protein